MTNFTNKFPVPLDINRRYEIGVENVGFSSVFKNLQLPSENIPSIIITNCQTSSSDRQRGSKEIPINWEFHDEEICGPERTVCSIGAGATMGFYKSVKTTSQIKQNDITSDEIKNYFQDLENKVTRKILSPCKKTSNIDQCLYVYRSLVDKKHTEEDVVDICKDLSINTGLDIKYLNKKIHFKMGVKYDSEFPFTPCFVLLHENFRETFNFIPDEVLSTYVEQSKDGKLIDTVSIVNLGGQDVVERKAYFNGHTYFAYEISHIKLPVSGDIPAIDIKKKN